MLQSDTAQYVHHLVLTGWYGPSDCGQACLQWVEENFQEDESDEVSSGSTSGSTSSPSSPSSYSSLSAFAEKNNMTLPSFCDDYNFADIFAWAPGASSVELPTDVGFRMGNASGGFKSLSLETHYDNPNGDMDMVDSSGVRVYYTEELRPIDMGVIKLGDPNVVLEGTYLPDGKYGMSFDCPGSCTEENFEVKFSFSPFMQLAWWAAACFSRTLRWMAEQRHVGGVLVLWFAALRVNPFAVDPSNMSVPFVRSIFLFSCFPKDPLVVMCTPFCGLDSKITSMGVLPHSTLLSLTSFALRM